MKILALLSFAFALTSCCMLSKHVEWVDYGDDLMQNPQFMEDMTAAGAPGPEHQALANRAGTWRVEGTMWLEPGAEGMPMTATATTEVVLGGRCIVEEFYSDFMGMPYEGRLMQGYDNLNREYWCVWSDNMSTAYWLAVGTETAPGHIELHGIGKDILTPKGRPMRMTVTDIQDGSYTMQFFDSREDVEEYKSMELHYMRS